VSAPELGWWGIVRLGLVQTALGAVVVLTTSTINRVMVVELALPAMLPGALVGLHYAVQVTRPRWGYGSDMGGRRTRWIVGGMGTLAFGGFGAAVATAWLATNAWAGVALAVFSFFLIGIGVGAAGTSLLALLAGRVGKSRRAAAATIVWLMMIAGFAVTATLAGHFLDPYSPSRLVVIAAVVSSGAFLVALAAVFGIERGAEETSVGESALTFAPTAFRIAMREVWSEPQTRRFSIFVFVSMIAYSAQDLVLEPFAGSVFGFTPGESTRLAGLQHAGVFAGMILVGVAGSFLAGTRLGSMRLWAIGGCVASSFALLGLAFAGYVGPAWPLRECVFALGVANGAYAVAAIASMMSLAGEGRVRREGTRMGLWGAAQAIAFGFGGFLGAASVDLARILYQSPLPAYATVFAAEAALFLAAGVLAAFVPPPGARVADTRPRRGRQHPELLAERP